MKHELTDIIGVAEDAVRKTGRFLLENLGKVSRDEIELKGPFDFVTHIDHQAEKMLIDSIHSSFPEHKIYAEEQIRQQGSDYRWIIDPLDGTTNYVHGHPVFSISLALEWHREIILGMVYDPTREEIFVAENGGGATLNRRPIRVSQISQADRALLATGFPFRKKQLLDPYLRCFQDLFTRVSGIRRMGSAALDLCYVACGRIDGFWEIGLSPWDVAAGTLIIREAGGKVSSFTGADDAVWSGSIIASNGFLHDLMVAGVERFLLPAMKDDGQ
ncbi:inositol monophosphatase [candidate division KSB1 bacterium]|nr:inositol monophosphatase [candidate division KSB1 bacterium]